MPGQSSTWLRASLIMVLVLATLASAFYLEIHRSGSRLQGSLQESLEYGSPGTTVSVDMGSCRLVANFTRGSRSITLTTSMVKVGVNGTVLGGGTSVTTTSVAEKPLPLVEYECNGSHLLRILGPQTVNASRVAVEIVEYRGPEGPGNYIINGNEVYKRLPNGTEVELNTTMNSTVKVDEGGYLFLEPGDCVARIIISVYYSHGGNRSYGMIMTSACLREAYLK